MSYICEACGDGIGKSYEECEVGCLLCRSCNHDYQYTHKCPGCKTNAKKRKRQEKFELKVKSYRKHIIGKMGEGKASTPILWEYIDYLENKARKHSDEYSSQDSSPSSDSSDTDGEESVDDDQPTKETDVKQKDLIME